MGRDEQPVVPRIVRVGIFEADLAAGELRREGMIVKLQDQPFRLLALLLEQPGVIVSRETLRSALWPDDTFIDFEVGLNTAIKNKETRNCRSKGSSMYYAASSCPPASRCASQFSGFPMPTRAAPSINSFVESRQNG
jgi:hypothetical protein